MSDLGPFVPICFNCRVPGKVVQRAEDVTNWTCPRCNARAGRFVDLSIRFVGPNTASCGCPVPSGWRPAEHLSSCPFSPKPDGKAA